MTVKQISHQMEMSLDSCSHVLGELVAHGLMECLNPIARQSRVYWLTELGVVCQRLLRKAFGLSALTHDFPEVDSNLYGWVCFSHRSAVIKALRGPMQPVAIKKRALEQNPRLRMSANNVRDVVSALLAKGIVRAVKIRREGHLRYELTEVGRKLQELSWRMDAQATIAKLA